MNDKINDNINGNINDNRNDKVNDNINDNYKMMRLPALPKCVCVLPMLSGGGSQVETAREGKL